MLGPKKDVEDGQRKATVLRMENASNPPLALDFLDAGPPAYVADLDGNLIYANTAYRAISRDATDGGLNPGIMPNPVFPLEEAIAQVIATGESQSRRDSLETDRGWREYRSTHYPIRTRDGDTLEAVGGIYEAVTAEPGEGPSAAHARERFDDIARLTSDWIWETDAEFRLVYVSPRASEVLDRHPRELIGQDLFELGEFKTPIDAPATTIPDRKSRSPFRNLPFDMTRPKGGNQRFIVSGLPVFADDGGFAGFRGTARDISAETEARARARASSESLAAAIENISEGFALFDASGRLVISNNRLRDYLDGVAEQLVPGALFDGILQSMAEHHLVAEPDDGIERWVEMRKSAAISADGSVEFRLASGRWVQVNDRPTESGGVVSIISDITEHKRREDSMRASKELAEQASRTKSEFLANMSHELRTPLNAIIGFSEIMRDEILGPIGTDRYRGYIVDIIDSSRHLLGVINDILDVAKSEAGKIEINETEVDLANEILITARLFAEQAAEAGVNVTTEIHAGLPLLRADQRKVRQILLNLISNAVKFTPPGGSVRVATQRTEDGEVAVSVSDTGIGIHKDDIAAALAPFGQVESAMSRRYAGTGLGLPLTCSLVEHHGGVLELESEPGKGTCVTIRFPVERVISPQPA
jgi:PAS domain S-box-containing protein